MKNEAYAVATSKCTQHKVPITTAQRGRLYSVVVITFGFDPNNPGSNPGTTSFWNSESPNW